MKIKWFFFVLIPLGILYLCYLYLTNPSKVANDFSDRFAKKIENHNLSLAGFGHSSNRHAISKLQIILRTSSLLNQSQARELIVKIIPLYIDTINTDPKLKKYLNPYPFSLQNIRILISSETPGRECEGQIIAISFYDGVIHYSTEKTNYIDKIDIFHEPFEDAVALVNEQKL